MNVFMSITVGVLQKTGTAYPSRAPVSNIFSFVLRILLCFRPVSCIPNVASVSVLSILDCPFGYS